ncbi:MAG: hypothetical protein M1840_005092 [Geoglossum simile]|nr:MAG: hypothetical protein M1840_005092 [Geoglossum simile]
MLEFLEKGLQTVGDHGPGSTQLRQDFINELATEKGLARIRQITETSFSTNFSIQNPMFHPHCVLFLQLISHEELRRSLALEKSVGTIFNVVYGLNGRHGIEFFQNVAHRLLKARPCAEGSTSVMFANKGGLFEESLMAATEALLQTMTMNQGASIKAPFKDIVNTLRECYNNKDERPIVRAIHQNVSKLENQLSMGDSVSHAIAERSTCTIPRQQTSIPLTRSELPVDFPGQLSPDGTRHDNDQAAIENIRILPTTEEILSNREEFLPIHQASPSQHHEQGIYRLLDSQFRLLREDTAGLLRDAVRLVLDEWDNLTKGTDWRFKWKILRQDSPTPVRIHFGASLERIKFDPRRGVEAEVEFDQARRAKALDFVRRKKWWYGAKELREGPLLALVDGEPMDGTRKKAVFLLVSKRVIAAEDADGTGHCGSPTRVRDLASDARRAMITLRLASPNSETDQASLISLAGLNGSSPGNLILLEFPAVFFNSFDGVLRRLQSLHQSPLAIPFRTWLTSGLHSPNHIPIPAGENTASIVPPAHYLTLTDSPLTLSCISNGDTSLTFSLTQDPSVGAKELKENTTLDSGQARALVSAMRHEIALIQGPPGTGKSFVGIQLACLLENRDKLRLGPIFCYTTHALDQFLHELLDCGVSGIIRMDTRTRGEKSGIRQQSLILEEIGVGITEVCKEVEEGMVKGFLRRRFPVQSQEIFGSEGGLVVAGPARMDPMESWVSGDILGGGGGPAHKAQSNEELLSKRVWTLTHSERTQLYDLWHESALAELSQKLQDLAQKHTAAKQQLSALYQESEKRCLDQAQVVGVTTASLANNADLLRNLRAKVLICEEAGEVLESHVLVALLPSIEHAILIGDHLQLRPRISNIDLSLHKGSRRGPLYGLDESLFERLANARLGNGDHFPVAQLDNQRRMHPSISDLVRKTLYPHLCDAPSTAIYPEIPGLRRRPLWLHHRHFEDDVDPAEPMQSKTNRWEAEMLTALVRHLSRQGVYRPGEIAVLTPYIGQLRLLKEMLGEEGELVIGDRDLGDMELGAAGGSDSDIGSEEAGEGTMEPRQQGKQRQVQKGNLLDGLRAATVDNFQGEEANVVIVSLSSPSLNPTPTSDPKWNSIVSGTLPSKSSSPSPITSPPAHQKEAAVNPAA